MNYEEEERHRDTVDSQGDRIFLNQDRTEVVLRSPKPHLTYLMISSQPGRRIIHPPSIRNQHLCFSIQKMQGINEDCEHFCAIGLINCLAQIDEVIQKGHSPKNLLKTVYISKQKISFKASACTHRLDSPTRKKKSYLNIFPPSDLNAHEIQPILEQFQNRYGQVSTVNIKKNCLVLSFDQEIQIQSHFRIKSIKASNQGETMISYWAITSHLPLFTFQPVQLIQLPPEANIKNLIIQADWVIFSTFTDVIFLNLYKSMELFLTLQDVRPQGIYACGNSRVLIFQYKYIHAYQLHPNKPPTSLGIGKTKKIQPFSIAFCKTTAVVGGINYSYMMNEPTCQKQLHVFQMFTTSNFHNKTFLADKTFQICKKEQNDAIKNLTYLNDLDLFFCSCGNSIYVFHLQTESLIASVDLNGTIAKVFEIDYPINLINCLVQIQKQDILIRVSFEQYCQIMGAEVSPAESYGEPKDFIVSKGKKKVIFMTDGELIARYENKNSHALYSCDEGKQIRKISTSEEALVYVTESNESIQIFFQQI